MNYEEQQRRTLFARAGVFWAHDGNPLRPHAALTKGGHSNVFFNGGLVTSNPVLLENSVRQLDALLAVAGCDIQKRADIVIGPATGAITLAHELARICSVAGTGKTILSGFAEKTGEKGVWKIRQDVADRRVIVCEDTVTTGGSLLEVIEACKKAGAAEIIPFVPVICNRSGKTHLGDAQIISAVTIVDAQVWYPEKGEVCLLCAKGSQALRPKGAEAWAALNANY